MVIIKGIRMDSLDNVIVVHKSDSAIQLINELLGELNNNKEMGHVVFVVLKITRLHICMMMRVILLIALVVVTSN